MKSIFLLLLFMSSTFALGQSNDEKIYWSNKKLTWNDFKAQPIINSPFHANTNSGISYSWNVKGDGTFMELKYEILSNFYPQRSWVRPESKNNYLLAHEQLHFDISELFARKLRKSLSTVSIENLSNNNIKKMLNKFYEDVDKDRKLMQLNYDKETNHSLNKTAEEKWQLYVEKELKTLEEFSS